MHGCWDSGLIQMCLQGFTIQRDECVLCENAGAVRGLLHAWYTGAVVEQLVVAPANGKALLYFPVKTFELGQDDDALQRIHAPADADSGMHITLALAMNAYLPACLCDIFVAVKNGAAIALAAEWFAREKAGAAYRR